MSIGKWPPESETERLERYGRYRKLFEGKHGMVFDRVDAWLAKEMDKTIIYIVANFAGLISKICADLLFGEFIQIHAADSEGPVQQALNAFVKNNNLHIRNYEMALSSSMRGDSVLKARFGVRSGWDAEPEVIIETVPAEFFFPNINGDNIQEMTGATLAWIKEDKANDKMYLRKEIHEPGIIRNELWLMEGDEVKSQASLTTFEEYKDLDEEQNTGYPGLLVEHIPNWRLDDMFWGFSDYYDLESLFDALNNRLSKIDTILDKHSDPKLILPPGSMRFDPRTGRYYIEKESIQVMEVDPQTETRDLPRYLVWDAKLEGAFDEIDKLLEMLMMMSEISPAAFGLDKAGVAESGRALKFKLLRTLAKINRKQLYFDKALKNILYAAQVLDTVHGSGSYEPEVPRIEWADGLPSDPLEQADVESTRITAKLTSRESALRRLDGLDGEALKAELDRINKERESERIDSPDVGQEMRKEAGAGGQSKTGLRIRDLNLGGGEK